MKRREYSAGAVKTSFWFVEFRKVVQLLCNGKSLDEVKVLAQKEKSFAALITLRTNQIFRTVLGRIKSVERSFMLIFLRRYCDAEILYVR